VSLQDFSQHDGFACSDANASVALCACTCEQVQHQTWVYEGQRHWAVIVTSIFNVARQIDRRSFRYIVTHAAADVADLWFSGSSPLLS